MRFATVSAALAAFASTAAAVPVSDAASASPSLSVKLSQIDNTRVKAVVTNSGKEDVDFVHLNFFRDSAPVKKVSVFRGSMSSSPSLTVSLALILSPAQSVSNNSQKTKSNSKASSAVSA